MTNSRALRATIVVLLTATAFAVALPFRERVMAQAVPLHYSWDAALHVLSGLDLADDLRRLALPAAALRLLTSHWWGPLWALATAPLYLAFGASLRTATLLPFAAFVLAPAAAWLFVRQTTRTAGLLAAPLVLVFLLRAPVLLEASAWPMFETFGGLASLAAFCLFARETPRAARAAYAVAATLFLLKYHYGVFLGATLLVATVAALTRAERSALAARLGALLGRPFPGGLLAVAFLLAVARFLTERSGPPRLLPSVSNLAWGALVVMVLAAIVRIRAARASWLELPAPLRDFGLFACAAPLAWLLDPANTRAFWRQIHQDWVESPPGPVENVRHLATFFPADFVASPVTLPLVAVGLVLALALGRRERTLPFAVLFTLAPPLAMCFAAFPLEPRFLGCLLPTLFAASTAGWVLFVRGIPGRARPFAALTLVAAALLPLPGAGRAFERTMAERVRYGYPNTPAEERFASSLLVTLPEGDAVAVALPRGPGPGPTIRLALRLSRRSLAPSAVLVDGEAAERLLEDLPGGARRVVLASGGEAVPAGFTRVERRAGPSLPGGGEFFVDTLVR